MRLAVLEDDPVIGKEIDRTMEAAGHNCHEFTTSRRLLKALREETFDLLLLDWNVPEFDGLQLLEWTREHLEPAPPVIMVTSRTDPNDIVTALEAGADDYVTKPFEPDVLAARVNALLRRSYQPQSEPDPIETLHGVTFDHPQCLVNIHGHDVALTPKEFGLALTFFRNMHRALSRTYLLETVWGRNPDLPTRTLDVHVSKLRSQLGFRPEQGFRLTPVHSFGYRLELIEHPVAVTVA